MRLYKLVVVIAALSSSCWLLHHESTLGQGLVTGTPGSNVLPGGLAAAYSFDATSGANLPDLSGNNKNGTLGTGTSWVPGKYGNALAFDGMSSSVSVPGIVFGGMFTFSFWYQTPTNNQTGIIIGDANGSSVATPKIGIGGPTNLFIRIFIDSETPPVPAAAAWHYFAITRDSSDKVDLYVDGGPPNRLFKDVGQSGPFTFSRIGANGDNTQNYRGLIDELRLYYRTLSRSEIQSDMNTPLAGKTPALRDTTPPTSPEKVSAAPQSSTQIDISWTPSTDNVALKGYTLERCQGAECTNFSQLTTTVGTSYSDVDLSGSTSYSYRVRAFDIAGNASGFGPIATSTTPATPPPLDSSDFVRRCSAPGVIKCVGFDDRSDIAGAYGDSSGLIHGDSKNSGAGNHWLPELDLSVKASGNSSLKFTIAGHSSSDMSGMYFTNFSKDRSIRFGAGEEFFYQWRQRFSDAQYFTTRFPGGGGWKQVIVGAGDAPMPYPIDDSDIGPNGVFASCTALEVVVQNIWHYGIPQMYHSCSGSVSHGPYDPFEQGVNGDIKIQNALPSCVYSQVAIQRNLSNCVRYYPNEWMTFQVHIKVGDLSVERKEYVGSYIQLWVAREGKPSQIVYNWGPYNLSYGGSKSPEKFGKIWLTQYNTGKSAAADHPTFYTWYDELIISRNRIPDPTSRLEKQSPK